MRRFLLLLPFLPLAGCKAIMPGVEDCSAPQPYQAALEAAPLAVPDGVDMPNTRNALRIPELTAPPRPPQGRCLDYPPRYRNPAPAP